MHRLAMVGVFCAAMLAGVSLATETVPPSAVAFNTAAASDQAPSSLEQHVNPSKSEPMMIEPSAGSEAAAYRRDLAACEERSAESRDACREFVNGTYGPEVAGSVGGSGRCDALDGAARLECLNGGTAGGQ